VFKITSVCLYETYELYGQNGKSYEIQIDKGFNVATLNFQEKRIEFNEEGKIMLMGSLLAPHLKKLKIPYMVKKTQLYIIYKGNLKSISDINNELVKVDQNMINIFLGGLTARVDFTPDPGVISHTQTNIPSHSHSFSSFSSIAIF
jgi:hypothetical protein